jgi:hypothetical protein
MRSMMEGACEVSLRNASTVCDASLLAPLPPHYVRSPLPAIAGRDASGVQTHRENAILPLLATSQTE